VGDFLDGHAIRTKDFLNYSKIAPPSGCTP
jgi:hypothetical protein